jgi:hypothetical protein
MQKALLLLIFIAFAGVANAQVVNIEARRLKSDSTRFIGDFNLALLINSTNGKNITTIRGNIITQYKSKNLRHIWLGVANYDFAKAEGDDFVNNFFVHFRYNYKVNNWFRWEAFVQSQTNEPLGINFRQLIGIGPRFKISLEKNIDCYLGTSYMYEYEKTIAPEALINRDHRSSNYASINIHIPKVNGSVISTFYYQPLFNQFSDFRLLNDTRVDISLSAKWRVYTRFSYLFDSQPPPNIRKTALNFEQGFGFSIR